MELGETLEVQGEAAYISCYRDVDGSPIMPMGLHLFLITFKALRTYFIYKHFKWVESAQYNTFLDFVIIVNKIHLTFPWK